MPNFNTWNGHWSGEESFYAKSRCERNIPKEIIGNSYFYDFGDGWSAMVTVTKINAKEANKIMKRSKGFMGYDWMIDSIIKNGKIICRNK